MGLRERRKESGKETAKEQLVKHNKKQGGMVSCRPNEVFQGNTVKKERDSVKVTQS
jgi:hypothetical protein